MQAPSNSNLCFLVFVGEDLVLSDVVPRLGFRDDSHALFLLTRAMYVWQRTQREQDPNPHVQSENNVARTRHLLGLNRVLLGHRGLFGCSRFRLTCFSFFSIPRLVSPRLVSPRLVSQIPIGDLQDPHVRRLHPQDAQRHPQDRARFFQAAAAAGA